MNNLMKSIKIGEEFELITGLYEGEKVLITDVFVFHDFWSHEFKTAIEFRHSNNNKLPTSQLTLDQFLPLVKNVK